jgi:hypothetical protein
VIHAFFSVVQLAKKFLIRKNLFTRFLLLNEDAPCEIGASKVYTDKNFFDTIFNFVVASRSITIVTLSW